MTTTVPRRLVFDTPQAAKAAVRHLYRAWLKEVRGFFVFRGMSARIMDN